MAVASQLPETLNLEFVRGDEFTRRFAFSMSSTPLDVSAWVITAQTRPSPDDSTSVNFTVDMTDAANGNVDITLSETQTTGLPGIGTWDFQAVIGGYTITLFSGTVRCAKDTTHA